MERIVAFVEGHMEVHFVRLTYANAVVMRPFPNGVDVPISQIIESIRDRLETIDSSLSKILILFDRKGRAESAVEILDSLRSALVVPGSCRSFYIGITDRMSENWILADEVSVDRQFGTQNYQYSGDGTFGKAELKRLNGGIDFGFRDKAELLKRSSAKLGSTKSASLANFIQQIDFDWYWAQR